eukprot:gene13201-13332_t
MADASPTLASVLEPLSIIPVQQRTFACNGLLTCLKQLERVQELLRNRKPAEQEALADQDRILVTWLSAYYHGISGTQAIIHGDLLETELTASGMVAPFVQPSTPAMADDGSSTVAPSGASFGVPTNITPEVMCDSVSELVRMATAALISLYVYLNFKQGPQDLAADEVLMIYTTIVIHSCANVDNAAQLDQQIQALIEADMQECGSQSVWCEQQQLGDFEQQQEHNGRLAFGCTQIRWLMHYVRGLVFHHMGAVYHLLGHREKQAEVYHAQQRDMQFMCKCLPQHPLGYSLFSRCAMNHQQMAVAAAFLDKGLAKAEAARHDAATALMSYQRAATLLLGGAGPVVDAAVVQQLLKQGEAARESVLSWFPEAWKAHASDGEPDRTLVLQKLLPELERRREGQQLPQSGEVEAVMGLLYVTKTPSSIPPGALMQLEVEGDGRDIEVIQE